MPNPQSPILKSKLVNSWSLLALIVMPMCIAAAIAMTRVDLSSPLGISAMIQFSVRLAVPWLFIAFAASSLAVIFPGSFSRWLLRAQQNKRTAVENSAQGRNLFYLGRRLEHLLVRALLLRRRPGYRLCILPTDRSSACSPDLVLVGLLQLCSTVLGRGPSDVLFESSIER